MVIELGILFSAVITAIKYREKFFEPNFYDFIVSAITELNESYPKITIDILTKFFSDKEVIGQIDTYRKKGKGLNFIELCSKFSNICNENHIEIDSEKFLAGFVTKLEIKLTSNPSVVEKIKMRYLQKISTNTELIQKGVDEIKDLLAKEIPKLRKDGIGPEIIPNEKSEIANGKNLETGYNLDKIMELIVTYNIPAKNIKPQIMDLLRVSSFYHQTNQPQKGLVVVEKILEIEPNNIIALVNKGVFLHMMKKYDESLKFHDLALASDPTFVPALFNKAISLSELERYGESRECFDKIIKKNPKDIPALLGKGVLLEDKLQLPIDAMECYDIILSIDPLNLGALHNKAVILKSLKKYDDALLCYENVLKKYPYDSTALAFKGYMFATRNDPENALKYLQQALDIEPNDIISLANKATALRKLGRYVESESTLDTVLTLNPNFPQAIFEKACVNSFQGKIEDSYNFLKKAITLNPNYKKTAIHEFHGDVLKDSRFQNLLS